MVDHCCFAGRNLALHPVPGKDDQLTSGLEEVAAEAGLTPNHIIKVLVLRFIIAIDGIATAHDPDPIINMDKLLNYFTITVYY